MVFTRNNGLYVGTDIVKYPIKIMYNEHSRIETTENYYISSSEKIRKGANDMLEEIIKSDVINKIVN